MPGASMAPNFSETILAFLPAVCTARTWTQTGSMPLNLSAQLDRVSPTYLSISTSSGGQLEHVSGTVAWNINCTKGVASYISTWYSRVLFCNVEKCHVYIQSQRRPGFADNRYQPISTLVSANCRLHNW